MRSALMSEEYFKGSEVIGGDVSTYISEGVLYQANRFATIGTFSLQVLSAPVYVDLLVVAGGGGSAGGEAGDGAAHGGGGGGGLLHQLNVLLQPAEYTVTVGAGGAVGNNNGGNSRIYRASLLDILAYGGGFGSAANLQAGSGGSGGGGGQYGGTWGNGVDGQGYRGAIWWQGYDACGGGGGGAGGHGVDFDGSDHTYGRGGPALTVSIGNTNDEYSAGGWSLSSTPAHTCRGGGAHGYGSGKEGIVILQWKRA